MYTPTFMCVLVPYGIEEWDSAEIEHLDGEVMTMRLVRSRLNQLVQMLEISKECVCVFGERGGGRRKRWGERRERVQRERERYSHVVHFDSPTYVHVHVVSATHLYKPPITQTVHTCTYV